MSEIYLESEQEELLIALVEAHRNISQAERSNFYLSSTFEGSSITHPGFSRGSIEAFSDDVEALIREDLILEMKRSAGGMTFWLAPKALQYYKQLKERIAEPVQRVEVEIRHHFDTTHFQINYPTVYKKWAEAERLLWESDSEQQLTVIGHLCREAMQEFADALTQRYQPSGASTDKAKTVDRIRRVLDLRKDNLGSTEKKFLDALLPYWGTVSDLVQRQEHGGQKESQPLLWEDGRRVVFQTAIVMFEIDRALSFSPRGIG